MRYSRITNVLDYKNTTLNVAVSIYVSVIENVWTLQHKKEVYPSYAVLLVLAPNDQDISMISMHDSEAFTVTDMSTNKLITTSGSRGSRVMRKASGPVLAVPPTGISARKGSNVAELLTFAKEEKRRRSTVTYNAFIDKSRQK